MHAILCIVREHKAGKRVEWDGLAMSPRYKFDPLPSSGGPQPLRPASDAQQTPRPRDRGVAASVFLLALFTGVRGRDVLRSSEQFSSNPQLTLRFARHTSSRVTLT